MKKLFKTGKKALSVIMAIMMVLSAWVWVAPTEASAAVAGDYYVRVYLRVYDGSDTSGLGNNTGFGNAYTVNESTGKPSGYDKNEYNMAGFTLFYRDTNGKGNLSYEPVDLETTLTEQTNEYSNIEEAIWEDDVLAWKKDKVSGQKYRLFVFDFPNIGFPTELYWILDEDNWYGVGGDTAFAFSKITVAKDSDSTEHVLWAGLNGGQSRTDTKYGTINISGTNSSIDINNVGGTQEYDDYSRFETKDGEWVYPYAETFDWDDLPKDIICPRSGEVTEYVHVTAKDQYGVQMFNPTWTVSGKISSTGISLSTSGPASGTDIEVENLANLAGITNSQEATITATWAGAGQTKTSSQTFTINDTTYDALFKGHRDANGNLQDDYLTNAQHGCDPTPPIAYDYADGDYDFTFTGWSPKAKNITSDTTYTATYSQSDKILADYTALNEALAATKAIKEQYGSEYELKFTYASRIALDAAERAAENAIVTGLGRTEQATVDSCTQALTDALKLVENTYDVIFLDGNGAIIRYDKEVKYKTELTPPDFPEEQKKYHDATNHYTYSGWDTEEYTSVLDDLVISPVYTAEAHDFETETVTSTCVQAGTTKHTCKTCGYTYYDGGDELGEHQWKDEFTVDLEPNCVLAGSKSIHCKLCDAQKDITPIEPKGHSWESFAVAVNPTCENIGISTRVCAEPDCRFCEHLIIDPLNHDYKMTTVKPTCTTKGYDEYVCQRDNCGHSYKADFIDVTAHTYGEWETVSEARCGVAGVKKQTCTECGFVNLGSIDALKHDLSAWTDVVEQTCTGKGYQVKTCSLCTNVIEKQWLDALGHNYVTKTTVEPTCTAKGYTIEECDRDNCGAQRLVNEKAALNHAWTSTRHEADCTHSAYIEYVCANDNSHNYIQYVSGSTTLPHDFTGTESNVVNATCTADGSKTVKCKNCTQTINVIIPKLGHTYSEWVKTDATNDKDGSWYHKCSTCGKEETLTIPKGGHNLVEDTDAYVAPKCNAKGQKVYKCTNHTDCTVTVTVELDYVQHTVTQKVTDASCTVPGTVKAYCSVCDAECAKPFSTTEIPVKAHAYTAQTPVDATCTTSGYTPYKCLCGASYNLYDASKPATGHSYTGSVTTAATCTTEGVMTYTCACGDSYTAPVSPVGHSYKVTEKAATCTTAGTKTYTCENEACGYSYTEFVSETVDHNWSSWTKLQEATTDSYGIEKRSCTVDGCTAVEHRTTAPTGAHSFEKISETAASCTSAGSIEWKCKTHENCEADYTETLDVLPHTQKIAYSAPTCIGEGSSKIICEKCGAEIKSETISATGIHDFSGEGVKSDAGCTATGTMTYTCKTDGCNEKKTETIPAKGHTFVTTVTDAKCGEKGSVVTSCTTCNDPQYTKTVELGAKGHIWGATPTDTKKATCEADGSETYKCQNCDATNVVVLPKLGHSWSEWTKVDATSTVDGYWTHTCSNCDKTETLTIPRGHTLVKDTKNSYAATCTADGKEIYICEGHTDCGVKIEITLTKLQHTVAQREIEATCENEGKVEAYCSKCNNVLSTETIPVKAHAYEAQTPVAPACTTSGYTPYKCSCGDTYNVYDASKPATGHTLIEGTSTANCKDAGRMTLTCGTAGCTYSTTVAVPALGHNYVEDAQAATAATCAAPATKTFKCSRCADSYTVSVGDKATAHTYDDSNWTVVESADETSLGYKTNACTVCGQLDVVTIPATGAHVLDTETGRKDATCTEKGWIDYKCSTHADCGITDRVEIPAKGHTEKLSYSAATCENAGYTKIICAVDGCTYGAEEKTIEKLGHLYGEGKVTDATCSTTGKIEYTCTRAGCSATHEAVIATNENAHQYATVVTPATCYKKGSVVTKCALCDDETTNEELPIVEHTWNEGEIKQGEGATCTADGKKTYTCTVENCGAVKVEAISKLGHSWGDWEVTKASTNTEKGTLTRACSRGCTETAEIPSGGHKLVVDTSKSTAATCTAEGTIAYKCENHTDCGITVTVTLDKIQHKLKTTKKDATCTEKGEVVTKCEKCDTTTIVTEIPETKHSYEGKVTTDATCTKKGVKTYTCSKCGDSYTETLLMLQHVYTKSGETAATCTSSGFTTYKCTDNNCTSSYVVITESAKGHSFDTSKAEVTATCTKSGTTTVKCSCGEELVIPTEALGHKFVKQGYDIPATCIKPATAVYECNCGESYTAVVDEQLGAHDWNSFVTVKEATNTSLGYKTRSCKVCGTTDYEIIQATGEHKFTSKLTEKCQAPTCTADGYDVYGCSAHVDCTETSKVTVPKLGHTAKLSYEAATCTKDGSAKVICEACDAEISTVTEIPALGHLFDGKGEYKAATCVAQGSMTYTCTRKDCNGTHVTAIEADGNAHKLKRTVDDATCEKAGSITIICENAGCTHKEVTTLPVLQHTWSTWYKKDSTNSENGYWYHKCTACNLEEILEIPAGGHKFENGPVSTTDATCKEQGTATYNCSAHANCGVTITVNTGYAEHTYETKVVESCTANGSVITFCTVCEKPISKVDLGMAQHKYDNGVKTDATCTSSGYITYTCEKCGDSYNEIDGEAKGHTLKQTVTSGSCTADGSVVLSCENNDCNYSVTVSVPALGHDYKLVGTTDATCAALATETYQCSRCEASRIVAEGTKSEEHNYPDEWTVVKEADFNSIGYKTRTCETCGQLEVKTIEATGDHKFEDGVEVKTVPATCTENGYVERKCSVHTGDNSCGKTAEIVIPATGHTEKVIDAVAATCTTAGSSAGVECTVCKDVLVKPVELPALGHTWNVEKLTPATCKEAGEIAYKCNCGETSKVIIEIDKTAHKYTTTVSQATCTDDGEVVTSCSLCGDTTTVTIPAKGHTFTGAETPVKSATCTENGEKTVKCANCNEKQTVIISRLGHNMVAGETVAPTCTTSGYTTYSCDNGCGESYKVYNEAVKNHEYVQVEDSSTATCTDAGTIKMECACGDVIETVVPAFGHSFGDWEVINPTAENEGSQTRECGICHVTETVTLPKLGHDMVKDVVASTAPTCTTSGTDVYVCTTHTGNAACGYTYNVTVAAKGHTYGEGVVNEGDKATCDTDGTTTYTCTVDGCDATITTVIPKTGHTLSTTVNEATCTAAGSVVTKCANCDYSIEKPLAQKPHSISVSYKYPSCTVDGYVKEKCDKCEYEYTLSETPALGHSFTGEETVEKSASCLENGEKTVKCSRCSETTPVEIPATGHNFIKKQIVAATCTESGYILWACDNEGCEASYKELTANPNGHTWSTTALEGATKATCEVDGKAIYKCQNCEATNEVITPKLGHSWTPWEVNKAPTATEDGENSRTCLRGCKETVKIPALGEAALYTVTFVLGGEVIFTQKVNYLGSAKAPEVAAKAPDANYHYTFSWDTDFSVVTGDITVTGIYTPVGHTFGEWVIDKTADCKNEGLRHSVCACGYVAEEITSKLTHDLSEIKEQKLPGCTENGYKVVVCKNCGETETQTLNSLGHSMTYYEGYPATCNSAGLARHYKCTRCGKLYEDRQGKKELQTAVLSQKYHTYVIIEGKAPTCTEDGTLDYRYCTTCGYTQYPDPIPATGHADINHDNKCDGCGAAYTNGGTFLCSCSCHKSGMFNELIYKILSFFWKLFGISKTCECGVVHY